MKFEFSRQNFEEKKVQISFVKIRPAAAELFHANGPDRHDEASRFTQFCERA
jgi:hypothetical protein